MTYLCVDVGSTWTKGALVDGSGLVATAATPTTLATDVMAGVDAVAERLGAQGAERLLCSSAGGGLRIAVVGGERLVTGEAGRRVALSSGGHVVGVFPNGLADDGPAALAAARPDLVVLVGGTDGGNPAALLAGARALGAAGLGVPVIVAGNAAAAAEAVGLLGAEPHAVAPNVVPEIGRFEPAVARATVRELFLSHVIGGKGLSRRADFAAQVIGATPDLVLRATEVLAGLVGDVIVVDVGGATTDVHSVVAVELPEPHPDEAEAGAGGAPLASEVVGRVPATRTVEGDLGLRWSAATTLAAGAGEGLLEPDPEREAYVAALRPDALPADAAERGFDADLARAAVATALRRHAGFAEVMFVAGQRVVRQSGTDVRDVRLVVGSGGTLRADPAAGAALVGAALAVARTPGRMLPERAAVLIDTDYALAPIGLLAARDPAAAAAVAAQLADRAARAEG